MKTSELILFLADPENNPDALLPKSSGPGRALAKSLMAALDQPNKRARNRAAKLLAKLSESHPRAVLPDLEAFLRRLDSPDAIVLWNTLIVVGNLAARDGSGKIARSAPRFHRLLQADSMVTAAHAIEALGKLAAARPALQSRIVEWLVAVDSPPHSAECREILVGKAVGAFARFAEDSKQRPAILAFMKRHESCPRPAVRKQIAKFLKRFAE